MMIKFRLYPENKSLYFLCYILDTKKAMRNFMTKGKVYKKSEVRKVQASMITSFQKNSKLCGVLIFCRKNLGTSTFTHEIFHATLAYAKRKRILQEPKFYNREDSKLGKFLEETLAGVNGELNRQFVNKCYDKKIYQ